MQNNMISVEEITQKYLYGETSGSKLIYENVIRLDSAKDIKDDLPTQENGK